MPSSLSLTLSFQLYIFLIQLLLAFVFQSEFQVPENNSAVPKKNADKQLFRVLS